MGTAFDMIDVINEEEVGIIPRAIKYLFNEIEARKLQAREKNQFEPVFDVAAQFVEVALFNIVEISYAFTSLNANIKSIFHFNS